MKKPTPIAMMLVTFTSCHKKVDREGNSLLSTQERRAEAIKATKIANSYADSDVPNSTNILTTEVFTFTPKQTWAKIETLSNGLPIYRPSDKESISFKILPKTTTKATILGPEIEKFYLSNNAKIIERAEIVNDWISINSEKTAGDQSIQEVDLYHIGTNGGFVVHLSGSKTSELRPLENQLLENIKIK